MGTYLAVLIVEVYSIHQLAIDIKLFVKCSPIAYSNWLGVAMASEMRELDLGKVCIASNVEHDWKGTRPGVSRILQAVGDEGHVSFRFLGETHTEQDVDCERAVADLLGMLIRAQNRQS